MDDHPYVYPYSRSEARYRGEEQKHEDSFRLNVECARAIEQAIREHFNEAAEKLDDCAQPVLEQYGFTRVKFVLANSVNEMGMPHLLSGDVRSWAAQTFVPPDGKYNRYFAADTAAALLEEFIRQANAVVTPDRWLDGWRYAAGLYAAHYAALYLRTYADGSASPAQAAATGALVGVVKSAALGDSSVSYDADALTKATADWGDLNATQYGQLLAAKARLVGMGGTYAI